MNAFGQAWVINCFVCRLSREVRLNVLGCQCFGLSVFWAVSPEAHGGARTFFRAFHHSFQH